MKATLVTFVVSLVLAATASASSVQVAFERYSWNDIPGFDRSCMGEDDMLDWSAVGSLLPGESFVFKPSVPGCEWRVSSGFYAFRGRTRKEHPLIRVTIQTPFCLSVGCSPQTITVEDNGNLVDGNCGFVKRCYRAEWVLGYEANFMTPNSWTFTMTNIGSIPALDVYVLGVDRQEFWWRQG